jgi:hypothetical protein
MVEWTALSARLYRWQSRVSWLGWLFGGAFDHGATKEYRVLILTSEGHVLSVAVRAPASIVAIKNVKIDFRAGEVETDAGAIARRQHDMACRL